MAYTISFLCVIGIATGQILFKLTADCFQKTGSYLDVRGLTFLIMALVLYGMTMLGWVWVLQKIELGKVYPFMALAFLLVPLASHYLFGERFQAQYFIGIVFIMAGIVITVKA